jgi:hypothetical protein
LSESGFPGFEDFQDWEFGGKQDGRYFENAFHLHHLHRFNRKSAESFNPSNPRFRQPKRASPEGNGASWGTTNNLRNPLIGQIRDSHLLSESRFSGFEDFQDWEFGGKQDGRHFENAFHLHRFNW